MNCKEHEAKMKELEECIAKLESEKVSKEMTEKEIVAMALRTYLRSVILLESKDKSQQSRQH